MVAPQLGRGTEEVVGEWSRRGGFCLENSEWSEGGDSCSPASITYIYCAVGVTAESDSEGGGVKGSR